MTSSHLFHLPLVSPACAPFYKTVAVEPFKPMVRDGWRLWSPGELLVNLLVKTRPCRGYILLSF